ncbi:unnamed protein product [Mesocestoides corti]|uniref:Glycos_trans_3N domain-containing protein n=1 Tax=Mesocestoides corti TaxID=53468 RepID=A0A0R3UD45_MESCO|nr:unnamed protein product [Mesocestoides corti]
MEKLYISQTLKKKADGNSLSDVEIDHYIKELVEGRVGTAQIGELFVREFMTPVNYNLS